LAAEIEWHMKLAAIAFLALLLAGCVSQAPQATAAPDTIPGPSEGATPIPTARTTAVPTATPVIGSCADSDGGKNAAVAGTVTAVTEEGKKTLADTCLGERVLEYYCDGVEAKTEQMDCDNGCLDGACKPIPPGMNFTLSGSPKIAFISPCEANTVTLNVRNGPDSGHLQFFASWGGKLGGSFNPASVQLTHDGFGETKVTASASGCYTRGNVLSNFTAQVCSKSECANKTIAINYTAGRCLNVEGCDKNESISGSD
jgi:hypothetical protein